MFLSLGILHKRFTDLPGSQLDGKVGCKATHTTNRLRLPDNMDPLQ
ncbi:hypothetical protein [Hymenobacter jejuensis]|nr:hypothetical protein [Hymenobacter jejuensis]